MIVLLVIAALVTAAVTWRLRTQRTDQRSSHWPTSSYGDAPALPDDFEAVHGSGVSQ